MRINALDLNAMDHCLDENDERSNCDPIDPLSRRDNGASRTAAGQAERSSSMTLARQGMAWHGMAGAYRMFLAGTRRKTARRLRGRTDATSTARWRRCDRLRQELVAALHWRARRACLSPFSAHHSSYRKLLRPADSALLDLCALTRRPCPRQRRHGSACRCAYHNCPCEEKRPDNERTAYAANRRHDAK